MPTPTHVIFATIKSCLVDIKDEHVGAAQSESVSAASAIGKVIESGVKLLFCEIAFVVKLWGVGRSRTGGIAPGSHVVFEVAS